MLTSDVGQTGLAAEIPTQKNPPKKNQKKPPKKTQVGFFLVKIK